MLPQQQQASSSSLQEDLSEETTKNILNDNVNIGTIRSCIAKIENSEGSSIQELAECCRILADLARECSYCADVFEFLTLISSLS